MSRNINEIFTANPTTTFVATDLMYLGRSPYSSSDDFGFQYSDLIPINTKGDIFVWSTQATKLPVGADQSILQADSTTGTGLAWSTATYPATVAKDSILYGSALNAIGEITAVNNATLVSDGAGTPSMSATLPNNVQDNITRLGTIASIGAPLGGTYGGTGFNNGTATIKYDDDVNITGAFTLGITLTGATTVTLPTSGTLAAGDTTLTSFTGALGDTSGNNFTLSTNNSFYYKVGKTVFFSCRMAWSSKASATAGSALVLTLPTTVINTAGYTGEISVNYGSGFNSGGFVGFQANPNTTNASALKTSTTGVGNIMLVSDCASTGSVQICGSYLEA